MPSIDPLFPFKVSHFGSGRPQAPIERAGSTVASSPIVGLVLEGWAELDRVLGDEVLRDLDAQVWIHIDDVNEGHRYRG